MINGIDVSYWQGKIDWDKVKNNTDFAIIRSSYGVGYTDQQFARNRDESRRVGILRGFYHYAYPNHNEPEAEARYFASVVGKPYTGELLVLDFEENYPDPVGWSIRFLDELSSIFSGYLPLIYLNKFTVQNFDWKRVAEKGYGLWLAYWDYDPDGTFSVPHWDVVAMRQYSNQGSMDGISGRIDLNVFYGSKDQYLAYGFKPKETCESILKKIQEENKVLTKSLTDLTNLYKKLLEEDKIEDEEYQELLKDFEELSKLYDISQDNLYKSDKKILELEGKLKETQDKLIRCLDKKYTALEALGFLFRAILGSSGKDPDQPEIPQ